MRYEVQGGDVRWKWFGFWDEDGNEDREDGRNH